jgi:macrolide transport system ATP-binding/permease protein
LHFDPAGAGYTIDRLPGLYRQIEDRFAALPGVTNVGLALYSPLEGDNWGECVIQQGHPAPAPRRQMRLHVGSRQHPLPRFHRRARSCAAAASPRRTPTRAPGRHRQPGVRQALLPQQDPIGQHFGIDDVKYSAAGRSSASSPTSR